MLIQAQAAALDLAAAEPAWGAEADARRSRTLTDAVLELEYTLIPHGLHVVGQRAERRPSASTCCCRWPRPRTARARSAR